MKEITTVDATLIERIATQRAGNVHLVDETDLWWPMFDAPASPFNKLGSEFDWSEVRKAALDVATPGIAYRHLSWIRGVAKKNYPHESIHDSSFDELDVLNDDIDSVNLLISLGLVTVDEKEHQLPDHRVYGASYIQASAVLLTGMGGKFYLTCKGLSAD